MGNLRQQISAKMQATGWMIGRIKSAGDMDIYITNQLFRDEQNNGMRIYSREDPEGDPPDISYIHVTFADKNVKSGTYSIGGPEIVGAWYHAHGADHDQEATSGSVSIERIDDVQLLEGSIRFRTNDFDVAVAYIIKGFSG
ncbi:hypothetical protein [Pseudomonas canadensis]|uniref:hypothetical protein n=1 Tax=Pseudomonas canadensis TaxID=915099 RepID=UPI0030DC2382